MTPSETPTPQTTPTPPADPAATPQPAVETPAAPAPQPAVVAPVPPAPVTGSSSKLPMIIAGLVGGLLVLLVLLAGWFMLWSPQAKAKRLSNSFMHAITTGDVSKAVDISGDNSAKDFLQTASSKVNGSYKMSDSTYQDGKGYYLYTLSGADKDYARTIVAKDNGKLVVTSFVYSDTKLRLIPGAAEDVSSDEKPATTSKSNSATASAACLVKSDYDAFGWTNTVDYNGTNLKTGNVHFLVDSLQYSDATQTTLLEPLVDFYKATSSKDYTIHLYGSVATTSEKDKTFANQRAEKVKAELISMGIPASKFVIEAPQNANDIGGADTDVEAQLARVVVWTITPGCTGTSSPSSSSSTGK